MERYCRRLEWRVPWEAFSFSSTSCWFSHCQRQPAYILSVPVGLSEDSTSSSSHIIYILEFSFNYYMIVVDCHASIVFFFSKFSRHFLASGAFLLDGKQLESIYESFFVYSKQDIYVQLPGFHPFPLVWILLQAKMGSLFVQN